MVYVMRPMREHSGAENLSGNKTIADAARWYVELRTAEDLEQLWPDFESWLRQSPDNLAAYNEIDGAVSLVEPHVRRLGRQVFKRSH